jgi:hypothetical protein
MQTEMTCTMCALSAHTAKDTQIFSGSGLVSVMLNLVSNDQCN